jgi:predicted CoA-substrate-specific enzyme activase
MQTERQHLIGMDVGSTTVKAVVMREATNDIVWQDYQRHGGRQAETTHLFLRRMEREAGLCERNSHVFFTGSGGMGLARVLGGRYVQEVNAVALAVEKYCPQVRSVIELGGQDAKIIHIREQSGSSIRRKIFTMNDKCAGGTGVILDKLSAKLKIPPPLLCQQRYEGLRLHPVAGRCGVFAETDINGLQKLGVPSEELIASLFEAVVLQNLTVLTRGHTLYPCVLLLGGPNTFIRGMREAWRAHIPAMWKERGVAVPEGVSMEELIHAPSNGHYFGALGAIEFAKEQDAAGRCSSVLRLERTLFDGDDGERNRNGVRGLWSSRPELSSFLKRYTPTPFLPPRFSPNAVVRAFLGIDGGSTSTKAVLLAEDGGVVGKAYRLSQGNPIQDTIELVGELRMGVESQGARLEILGAGTTGYAKDILQKVLGADAALVETVAHARSALHFYNHPDVIVDLGGQDIKLIILKNGHVKDFMLNTQCSAGNGYFLQATAHSMGLEVSHYAQKAFAAERMPEFSHGCAVFLQADIVNFQRQGWQPEEILAGLAAVLPKNIWLYVAKIPNLASLGRCFVLQGGTQKNLAAVKAQVNYIRAGFQDSGQEPEIIVHEHCGEAGAVGAALEAAKLWKKGKKTEFIGIEAVSRVRFRTITNEETRCTFCKNHCLRTFVDFCVNGSGLTLMPATTALSPLHPGMERFIVANCEKGTAQDVAGVRSVLARMKITKQENPNLAEKAGRTAWKIQSPPLVADRLPSRRWTPAVRRRQNIVYSDRTTDAMYREGARRGAIDPCFPSKVVLAHFHNLIYTHHRRTPLDYIFLPMFDVLTSPLVNSLGTNACPTAIATPQTARAAFVKETDIFAKNGITYLHPLVDMADRQLLSRQMFKCWGEPLGLSREEHERALEEAYSAQHRWESNMRKEARAIIDKLEREQRLGILLLGRPYHHDPGLSHSIFEEFQKRGYPVLSQSTLPLDEDLLDRLFGVEVRAGIIKHPLDITDVWQHPFSASTSHKIWAAKFAARHPNLVAVEISNFKCGHDAMTYRLLESILEWAGRPYFSFRDIDENKPTGSIKIRVETIDYFLKQHRENLLRYQRAA